MGAEGVYSLSPALMEARSRAPEEEAEGRRYRSWSGSSYIFHQEAIKERNGTLRELTPLTSETFPSKESREEGAQPRLAQRERLVQG